MSTAYLVTMLVKPAKDLPRGSIADAMPIFRFISSEDESAANYRAGVVLDALADYHGLEFDYRVEPIPVVHNGIMEAVSLRDVVRLALKSGV